MSVVDDLCDISCWFYVFTNKHWVGKLSAASLKRKDDVHITCTGTLYTTNASGL